MKRLNKIVFAALLIVAVGAASCSKNYYTSKSKGNDCGCPNKKGMVWLLSCVIEMKTPNRERELVLLLKTALMSEKALEKELISLETSFSICRIGKLHFVKLMNWYFAIESLPKKQSL